MVKGRCSFSVCNQNYLWEVMMNPTIIHKTKWFWPWQDNLEEAWLAQMSQQGLHLKQAHRLARYDFVKGTPETYAYRLDFQDPLKNERREE